MSVRARDFIFSAPVQNGPCPSPQPPAQWEPRLYPGIKRAEQWRLPLALCCAKVKNEKIYTFTHIETYGWSDWRVIFKNNKVVLAVVCYCLFIITMLHFTTLLFACFAIMPRPPGPLWLDRGTWITLVQLLIKSRAKNASPYKETDDDKVSFNTAKSLLQSVSSKLRETSGI